MNYGKENARRQLRSMPSRKVRTQRRFILVFVRTVLICMLFMMIAGGIGGIFYAKRLINQLPDASTINISPTGYLTTVLDSDGQEIERLAASGSNREHVTLDQIPVDLQHAFVAIEDYRFYEHNGVDVKGMARAFVAFVTSGGRSRQGASTITQQLLKNNYFTTWTAEKSLKDRIDRKIQEQYMAVQLEKITDKDTILENYLNTINLGQNTLGVEAASKRYFNKSVSELTLSECAVIAGITQNPSKYNPITHSDYNATRRKKVLDNMLSAGFITQEQYDEAMDDDVYDRIQVVNTSTMETRNATSYFVDALTDELVKDLTQKGYSETEAYQMLYSGGLTVYSTQDTSIQKIAEEEVNNQANYVNAPKYSFTYRLTVTKPDGSTKNYSEQTMLSYYKSSNTNYNIDFDTQEAAAAAIEEYKQSVMEEGDVVNEGNETITYTLQPQAACTLIDQSNGHVVALVGGRGDKSGSKTLNRAYSVTRQPGSTFKILSTYAPALDSAGQTLATVQDDAPMTYANGASLKNVDGRFRGYMNYREAIVDSVNIVAVKALTEIGTGLGYQYVQNFGITTLTSGDNTQALSIGGITKGATNLELTAAYAAIANAGEYYKPVFYTQVLDRNGNVILDNTENQSKAVIKKTTAWLLTSAMEDVMTQGTGTPANFSGQAVAGKSGTTNDSRDFLFEGYTPYYTCGIWGGYDDNASQNYSTYTKTIWRAIMSRVHEGLESKDFKQPSGIVTAEVCKKSGKLAVPGLCDADPRGSQVYTEYFTKDTLPTETCDRHVAVTVDTTTNQPATDYCPQDVVASNVFILDGSAGTEDEPYSISSSALSTTCEAHATPQNVGDVLSDLIHHAADALSGQSSDSTQSKNNTDDED